MKNLFDVAGKVALVTGSSRGIGNALARGLASSGCIMILNGTNKETLDSAVNRFKADGLEAFGYNFDVTNESEVNENIERIQNEVGLIDILVNNAGIQIRGPLENFEYSDWQKVINTNLTSAFLLSKAAVKGMIERKAGKIINICSVQSELARPSITPYTASKGGLRNLTRGMAAEWGKFNIQINGIAPGYFKTEMTKSLYQNESFDSWLRSRTPANRWGDPEELIGSLIFLASKASNYINGHIIYVDGGLVTCV
jgi:gluconate 5-dehydrogenase